MTPTYITNHKGRNSKHPQAKRGRERSLPHVLMSYGEAWCNNVIRCRHWPNLTEFNCLEFNKQTGDYPDSTTLVHCSSLHMTCTCHLLQITRSVKPHLDCTDREEVLFISCDCHFKNFLCFLQLSLWPGTLRLLSSSCSSMQHVSWRANLTAAPLLI
ncbi:hypothetical protein SETIT_3G262700v2 [Setaria italica]|uniref:Uncharacterized protein n=1 Tax=Setaria italica TaxID=4555 RepID=A0A368QJI3_SETIT|nr:hypothetical protein SETIT_3G262700v2 [Setaria italica]